MTEPIQHHYALTDDETAEVKALRDTITEAGRLVRTDRDGRPVTDAAGRPVPAEYTVLRSRRFIVDADGVVWRFFAEGSAKTPDSPDRGGAPWRNNRVEMWTGRWRAVRGADGRTSYAKVLVARPLDKRINGHPGMSQIQYYRTAKGYRHPHEPPAQRPRPNRPPPPRAAPRRRRRRRRPSRRPRRSRRPSRRPSRRSNSPSRTTERTATMALTRSTVDRTAADHIRQLARYGHVTDRRKREIRKLHERVAQKVERKMRQA